MAYRFPLATVLRFRQTIEEQEERALEKVFAEIVKAEQQIDALAMDIAGARRKLEADLTESMPAGHVDSMRERIEGAVRLRQQLVDSLAELHRRRDEQVQRYQAAHNSRKVLSDMQERQRDAYEQERDRAEQKTIDDIFASRSQRS